MMNFVYVLDTAQLKCPDLYEYWYRKMPEARQKKIDAFKLKFIMTHMSNVDSDMKNHGKKMIAPIVITIVFLLYLAVYITVLLLATDFSPVMILFAIPLFALGIGMIYVLKIRINEIRSGEEDDLSNY